MPYFRFTLDVHITPKYTGTTEIWLFIFSDSILLKTQQRQEDQVNNLVTTCFTELSHDTPPTHISHVTNQSFTSHVPKDIIWCHMKKKFTNPNLSIYIT